MPNEREYPLVFTFRDLIVGRGFVAGVELAGRALLVEEEEGTWLYGVTPGGLAASGRNNTETLNAFRGTYRAVLQSFTAESTDFAQFKAAVDQFAAEESDVEEWAAAVADVRSRNCEVAWVRTGNADAPLSVRVFDVTLHMGPEANPSPYDDVALACAA